MSNNKSVDRLIFENLNRAIEDTFTPITTLDEDFLNEDLEYLEEYEIRGGGNFLKYSDKARQLAAKKSMGNIASRAKSMRNVVKGGRVATDGAASAARRTAARVAKSGGPSDMQKAGSLISSNAVSIGLISAVVVGGAALLYYNKKYKEKHGKSIPSALVAAARKKYKSLSSGEKSKVSKKVARLRGKKGKYMKEEIDFNDEFYLNEDLDILNEFDATATVRSVGNYGKQLGGHITKAVSNVNPVIGATAIAAVLAGGAALLYYKKKYKAKYGKELDVNAARKKFQKAKPDQKSSLKKKAQSMSRKNGRQIKEDFDFEDLNEEMIYLDEMSFGGKVATATGAAGAIGAVAGAATGGALVGVGGMKLVAALATAAGVSAAAVTAVGIGLVVALIKGGQVASDYIKNHNVSRDKVQKAQIIAASAGKITNHKAKQALKKVVKESYDAYDIDNMLYEGFEKKTVLNEMWVDESSYTGIYHEHFTTVKDALKKAKQASLTSEYRDRGILVTLVLNKMTKDRNPLEVDHRYSGYGHLKVGNFSKIPRDNMNVKYLVDVSDENMFMLSTRQKVQLRNEDPDLVAIYSNGIPRYINDKFLGSHRL